MTYPAINHRRIPYNIDGTLVGYNVGGGFANPPGIWFTTAQLDKLNAEVQSTVLTNFNAAVNYYFWFFFTEKRTLDAVAWSAYMSSSTISSIQGSNDTTNGVDGTWETVTFAPGSVLTPQTDAEWYRRVINTSFSQAYKAYRFQFYVARLSYNDNYLYAVHLYGESNTRLPSDIEFCDASGNLLTAIKDWGDVPRGSSQVAQIYIKNISSSGKTANNIVLADSFADISMSLDNTTWTTSVTISSLASNVISFPIYLKCSPSLTQALGTKSSVVTATVGSWT